MSVLQCTLPHSIFGTNVRSTLPAITLFIPLCSAAFIEATTSKAIGPSTVQVHGRSSNSPLRHASAIIAASLPTDAIAARLGGDEFACAIPFDSAAPEVVDLVAESIVARLSRPLDAKGINAHISVSVGIARTEPDCETIEALIRRAVGTKWAGHHIGQVTFVRPNRSMSQIGG